MISLTTGLSNLGFTRDSATFVWGKWLSFSILILSGFVPLDNYFSPKVVYWMRGIAVVTLMLSGHYDKSPLPGAQK